MSDPSEQASARIRAAADQFGAALGDAFKLSIRQAVAKQIAETHGPGPWVLHEDGRVETVSDEPTFRGYPAKIVNRVLWNVRDGDIDEVVISNCTVHIEQMHTRCWWIGITRADGGYWAGNFQCDSRGRMTFTEQEHDGFDWDHEAAHNEPKNQTEKGNPAPDEG